MAKHRMLEEKIVQMGLRPHEAHHMKKSFFLQLDPKDVAQDQINEVRRFDYESDTSRFEATSFALQS